jgi:hypothetical protein
MINRFAFLVAVSAVAAIATPAVAGEVGVGVGPVGVTVGSGPDRVVREREVIHERDRAPDKIIIKKEEHRPKVIEKKTIIHDHD